MAGDGPDTALARHLLDAGAADLQTLQAALQEVRQQRLAAPGATLAAHLRAQKLVDATSLAAAEDALAPRVIESSLIGSLIDGTYRIERLIGEGGMGQVFAATDERMGKPVALKLLHHEADEESLARFEREAQLAARVDRSEGLVRIHAAGKHRGMPYFAMERIEGKDLAAELRQGPIEPERLARLSLRVARTLAHCHAEGIVHRDLKPANVLLRGDDPLLTDFGIARSGGTQRLTHTGELLGTPSYMAPEQARDSRTTTAAADVYSLGAILYHGLCGRPPFSGSVLLVLAELTRGSPPPPHAVRPEVDRRLEAICLRAMAFEPDDRYPDAGAMADDLERYLRGDELAPRPGKRLLLGISLALLALLALGVAALTSSAPLTEHEAWDERVLAPFLEQVGASPLPPLDRADLDRRLRRLSELEGARGIDEAQRRRLLQRALSAQQALALASGDPLPEGEGEARLRPTLAALRYERGGDLRRALASLGDVELTPGGQELAQRVAGEELRRCALAWIDDPNAPLRLERALAQVQQLGMSSARLEERKLAALAEALPAWSKAFARDVELRKESNRLESLVQLLRAPPSVAPPPDYERLLETTFRSLLGHTAELEKGPGPMERLLRWDRLWYVLVPDSAVPESYPKAMAGLWQVHGERSLRVPDDALLVFLWRNVAIDDGNLNDNIADYIAYHGLNLDRLAEKYPTSRAVRFCRWAVLAQEADDGKALRTYLPALIELGLEVLAAPGDDLGPLYEGELLAEISAYERVLLEEADARDAEWDRRWERARGWAQRARTLTYLHKMLVLSWTAESELLGLRARKEERLALWTEATRHLRKHPQPGQVTSNEDYLREAYSRQAEVFAETGDAEGEVRALRLACECNSDDDDHDVERRLLERLAALGRVDEAFTLLDETHTSRFRDQELLAAGVRLHLEHRGLEGAKALLRRCKEHSRVPAEVIESVRREIVRPWRKANQGKD